MKITGSVKRGNEDTNEREEVKTTCKKKKWCEEELDNTDNNPLVDTNIGHGREGEGVISDERKEEEHITTAEGGISTVTLEEDLAERSRNQRQEEV